MLWCRLPKFGAVWGVATGGTRLALEMSQYSTEGPALIVDDVLTTGASMEKMRLELEELNGTGDTIGAVVFSRGLVPGWITPLFRMEP